MHDGVDRNGGVNGGGEVGQRRQGGYVGRQTGMMIDVIKYCSDLNTSSLSNSKPLVFGLETSMELKSLGESYSESLKTARELITARCDHEKRKSAVACMMEVVGEKNPEHFFLATQDADLREKLQEVCSSCFIHMIFVIKYVKGDTLLQIMELQLRLRKILLLSVPGVPLIFGLRNALLLESPSAFQRQFAKSTEEGRLHMSEAEYKMLRTKNTLEAEGAMKFADANESEGDQNGGTQAMRKANDGGERIGVKDKVQFKRKKAKGPNPLSCKKKKNLGLPTFVSKSESNDGSETIRSRSNKKRKRSRKGKKLEATNG
ncbi:hypothetical protein RHGRI_026719 [Rhododendron griersonianum]|uniref:UTP23 sensor motif region domain-containing protein n=1 Tax=Rhododendron griersonianum TaxID=479676 RepID=A0AAV6IZC6_9ERIC|nr:hypothetical protein RHGRI_026719 [Rhododendron griersonianum]